MLRENDPKHFKMSKENYITSIGYFLLSKGFVMPQFISKSIISFQERSLLKNILQKLKINCIFDI